MEADEVISYYRRDLVKREIFEYSRMRWVAVESRPKGGERTFIRYWWRGGPPLAFSEESSIERLLYRFRPLNVRTFYASVNVYKQLSKPEDVDDLNNVCKATPIWDIDGSLYNVKLTLEAARAILDVLEKHGVRESVYLKWSGRGLHVHLHEDSISEDVTSRIHPLDVAYAIVEYVIMKSWGRIKELVSRSPKLDRDFKVENKIDIQRVFTAPLSLHREYDIVAVCFKPDELDSFDISWTYPSSFKHNVGWRKYVEGEADQLALEAYKEVGGYAPKMGKAKTAEKLMSVARSIPRVTGKIGRFQVMGLLQAARYYLLTGDLSKAKSFGLNRAIFFAWAKHYKPRYGYGRGALAPSGKPKEAEEARYKFELVGNEKVPVSDVGYFVIGETVQTPTDFDKEIADKINSVVPFEYAWRAAIDYVSRFPKETLKDQQEFYKRVYEPVRDTFIEIIQEYIATEEYERKKGNF